MITVILIDPMKCDVQKDGANLYMSQGSRAGSGHSQEEREPTMELLRGYEEAAAQLRENEEALINTASVRPLTEALQKHEELFKSVKTASTMVRDCAGVNRIVKLTAQQTQSVNLCPRSMNLQNVRSNLFAKYGQNPMDLEQLGEWALRKSKTVAPATSFLFGLGQFQPVQRVRTQRQRAQRDEIQEMKGVGQKETPEGRTNQLLARAMNLCDKLKKRGETPLARAITSSESFAQTVQNAFDLSHLIRDGRVGLQVVDECIIATAKVDGMQQGERRQQAVLHLRQSDYQKLMENPSTQGMLFDDE